MQYNNSHKETAQLEYIRKAIKQALFELHFSITFTF